MNGILLGLLLTIFTAISALVYPIVKEIFTQPVSQNNSTSIPTEVLSTEALSIEISSTEEVPSTEVLTTIPTASTSEEKETSTESQEISKIIDSTISLNCTIEKEIENKTYYPKCDSSYISLVDALKSLGIDSSYENRKSIALLNNIIDYTGTSTQNTELLNLLKKGELIKSITKETIAVIIACEEDKTKNNSNYYTITDEQMKKMGWKKYNLEQLNRCINEFNITTTERIRHFIAQCSSESSLGQNTIESGNNDHCSKYDGRTDLGNTQPGDGCKYKGAGYIQLTGRYNYQQFADYMGDKNIMEGADYVAKNYPWISAGFWWKTHKMNSLCDKGASVETITRKVNGGTNKLEERKKYYELACSIFL